MIATKQIAVW